MATELEASWLEVLGDEFKKDYMLKLKQFLIDETQAGKTIYPKSSDIFNAFWITPFTEVKVVIIGQDPYHGPNQAHGLSFSVQKGVATPPSLQNIYKELATDIPGFTIQRSGELTHWAEQGVLLLNAILTVRLNEPASHAKIGWMDFTDAVIKKISDNKKGIIFLLWGNFAQQKQTLIDEDKHFLLKAAHPSPFSANRGFFGCKHFSKTNELLIQQGYSPIDWKLFTPTQQQIKFSNEG